MEQDGKKISFGFSKLTKKSNVIQKPTEVKRKDIQLIDCLEGQTIKLKNVVKEIKGPLIIPLPLSKTIFDHHKENKIKRELKLKEETVDDRPDSELTPDELAARELIRDAQNSLNKSEGPKVYSLPAVLQNTFVVDGKEEPTMDDYESVPINEYGMAMLRGMGWSETKGVGKIPGKDKNITDEPALRPKGLGLGANRLISSNKEKSTDKNGEELVLKKGGYAKIIEGKHKGSYCEVQGFDEDGRIIVKTSVKNLIINLNELLVKPVTKEEYAKSSKVINNAKYEEYKSKIDKKEQETQINLVKDSMERRSRSKSGSRRRSKSHSTDSDNKSSSRRKDHRSRKEDDKYTYKKKSKKKYRSSSISSTDSDYKKRKERKSLKESKHKSKKSKHRKGHRSNSDYDSDHNHARKSHSRSRH
ncbi:hypothetical protein ILUMI_26138 [Ignelater luminosus]|uniref:G-patch domain-containing protein n=1 Tax=Ignelater luminosus TaxID=2038154 RepID=A0A8K0FXH5_IGNLU|nr:hypothetical protein ILUMI_26138 [Ignelater luminosus]